MPDSLAKLLSNVNWSPETIAAISAILLPLSVLVKRVRDLLRVLMWSSRRDNDRTREKVEANTEAIAKVSQDVADVKVQMAAINAAQDTMIRMLSGSAEKPPEDGR